MDKYKMALHNETLARVRIRAAYKREGIITAMRLCAEYMSMDMRQALTEVRELCADIWKE